MNNLIQGTIPQVEKEVAKCNSRKQIRLALEEEKANKNRKGVIALLENKIQS